MARAVPTLSSMVLPPPRSWDEFEELALAAAKLRWRCADFFRNGRPGQRQRGVDIWGRDRSGGLIAIQCKNTLAGIDRRAVRKEVAATEEFAPAPDHLYIATAGPRDASIQEFARELTLARRSSGGFPVDLLFWDDLAQALALDETVWFSFYPQFRPLAARGDADERADVVPPLDTLTFHDSIRTKDAVFLLATQPDEEDREPIFDLEGVVFRRRHVFVLRRDLGNGGLRTHRLSRARLSHTAMRILDGSLHVFFNEKVAHRSFAMDGVMFRLDEAFLEPNMVRLVFEGENWGWDPWIDEAALVHHKDSATPGNPYMIEREAQPGRNWRELGARRSELMDRYAAFPQLGGSDRRTGYLRSIDVPRKWLVADQAVSEDGGRFEGPSLPARSA